MTEFALPQWPQGGPGTRTPRGGFSSLDEVYEFSGPIGRKILEVLSKATEWLSAFDLAERVYTGPDGGPEWAVNSIRVTIHKLKKRLQGTGYAIDSWKSRWGGYKLIKLEDHK